MRKVPFLDLRPAHREVEAELDAAVRRVVQSGRYIPGPERERFETEFAAYVGVRHCVGVGNGHALRLTPSWREQGSHPWSPEVSS